MLETSVPLSPWYCACLAFSVEVFGTQSNIVAQLTLLVAITALHRSCSVAAEPLHR